MATSYTNPGGSGSRTGITVSITSGSFSGPKVSSPDVLIDGLSENNLYFNGGSTPGAYLLFDFGNPRLIEEARLVGSIQASHGIWQWAGSNDNVTFENIGATFTLSNGVATTPVAMTTLNTNAKKYRYYKLIGVSGSSSAGPYLYEMEFRIDVPVANKYLFQDGTDIKKYAKGGYSLDKCTGGTVLSSAMNGSYSAAKAFDNDQSTNGETIGTAAGEYYGYQFASAVHIRRITVSQGNSGAATPLTGSVTGAKLQRYDTATSAWQDVQALTLSQAINTVQSFDIVASTPSTQWRLVSNSAPAGGYGWVVNEIEMIEFTPDGWISIGVSPATKAMFDGDGMTDLSIVNDAAIQALVSASPELLVWTDEAPVTGYTSDVVPALTGDNAPSPYVMSASGYMPNQGGPFYPWYVFDNNNTNIWIAPINSSSGWLKIDLGSGNAKKIVKYTLMVITGAEGPKSWTLEGSNDDSTYTVVDTQSNISLTSNVKSEFTFTNSTSYRYWKLNISSGGSGGYLQLNEWELMEAASPIPPSRTMNTTAIPNNKLVIPVGDLDVGLVDSLKLSASQVAYKTIVPSMTSNTSSTPVVASASSDNNGVSQAWRAFNGSNINADDSWMGIPIPAWLKVDLGAPKVVVGYRITARNVESDTSPQAKNWTFEGWDGSKWIVLDTQINQTTSINAGDKRAYSFTNGTAYNAYRLNISASNASTSVAVGELELFEAGSTDIKVLASGDSGVTWKSKTGSNWLTVDNTNLATVKANGMTPAQVNALTAPDWAGIVSNGKLRLAYYIEQSASTDTVTIDKLQLNQKVYTMTPTVSSLSVLYNLLQAVTPDIFVSRDDGVTWKMVTPDVLAKLDDLPAGKNIRVKAVLAGGQELQGLSYSWI